jgi:tetratricopeptide (TPR) repeat protein
MTTASESQADHTPPSGERRSWWWRGWLAALFLVVAPVMAYWPALHGGFIWDDNDHISTNLALRSPHGLWEIWFRPGATCQFYPMTFTVFWLGYQLWGLNPLGYHLLNVLLHCLVALLLWQVLARLQVKGAWLAGAMFALHPVCVMSVAWMTELKNTLSAALALAAAWSYLRFAGLGTYETKDKANLQPSTVRWGFYALSLVLFQLALFAKTAVSFLPVSLFLITWWRRERPGWRGVWPLIPMLGLAGAMGKLTFYIEHLHGSSGGSFNLSFLDRVLVSGRSFWFYLGKLFYPYQLTFIYERWPVAGGVAWQYLYPLATAGLLVGLWWGRRRLGKGLLVALLHFYVCTSLLILLTVLYMTRYSFVSDHWQYFGCMSVIALAAAGITTGLGRFESGRPWLKPALGGMLLLMLGVLTWRQCGMYADLETLWQTTLTRNPRCFLAHNNLGEILARRGLLDEASAHFQKAMQIRPDFAEARYNFGNVLLLEGRPDEAAAQFQKVLEIQPDYAEAHNNLGNVLLEQGRVAAAMDHFQTALKIQPDFAEAHYNLGKALLDQGKVQEALAHCDAALKAQPDAPETLSLLAWVLATWPEAPVRNGAQAIKLAQRANELSGGRNPLVLRALAAAYAEGGQFAEAVATARQALQLADARSDARLIDSLRTQLGLYQAGVPFRDLKTGPASSHSAPP